MRLLQKYFPNLTEEQLGKFKKHHDLFIEWNAQINMVSRKDMDNLTERHILHSLAIAKCIDFLPKTKVLDVGTGGGFPGIPLAIMFPEVQFFLVDSIEKKIKVVRELKKELQLDNVEVIRGRSEDFKPKVDFVVTRAVARTAKLLNWNYRNVSEKCNHEKMNGFFCLKGGDLTEELEEADVFAQEFPISEMFEGEFFETKKVVYIPMQW